MATKQRDSTILHEHRRVVTWRYILAAVNFLAIFLGTLVTRHFVLIRGSSEGLLLHINILCIINILQIAFCLGDFFLRTLMGVYSKAIVVLSYLAGVLWVTTTCGELFVGSMDLGALRFDLLIIAALQLVSAIMAYLIWPSLDHASIRSLTRPSIRDDFKRRGRLSIGYAVGYGLICALMVFIQIGMFFAYQLPPRVYDLFSDTRALEYRLNSDKTGYYVAGLYRGTSDYVCVPETYNNKPVVGLAEGSLSDSGFLAKHKVSKIDLGEPVEDKDGNVTYKSNLMFIEKGAINNDRITELRIPVSVVSIEDGAFDSASLSRVIYEARADFSIGYFVCEALDTVTLEGEDVGNIVSLEGLASSVTIEVSKDNYNRYRKNNIQYGHSLRPILPETEFYVDFYTNCDYYIESIFGTLGESIEVGVEDLVNSDMGSMVSPMVDTKAYMLNRKELGTAGAKDASAFRGWFYDTAFGNECTFRDGEKISFSKTSAIYAKWIDEYKGELDWGNYPALDVQTLYWTDEDVTPFPVIKDRLGYSGGIEWYASNTGNQVTNSKGISENVDLKGVWLLDKPSLDIDPVAAGDWLSMSPDKNAVEFVYDENNVLTLNSVYSHVLDEHYYGGKTVVYSLVWEKEGDESFNATNTSIQLQNVPEAGDYVLTLQAQSPYGEVSSATTNIKVSIAKKELNIGDFSLVKGEHYYDSLSQVIGNSGSFVHNNIQVTYTYVNEDGETAGGNSGVVNAGKYTVVAIFEKDNPAEAANYTTRELRSDFTIKPRELTFDSWSDGELTYNSASQSVLLSVGGILAGDEVEINYDNNTFTNAGNYTAEAISVSNPNYTLAAMLEHCRYEWSIAPKEITVKEWKLDGASTANHYVTYNGVPHTVTAVPGGVFNGDTVNFTYAKGADTVTATNADTYTARINGVDNPNYTFDIESAKAELAWKINKRVLSVAYSVPATIVYNGQQQGVIATVTNLVAADVSKFTNESFLYADKSDILKVVETAGAVGSGQLTLTFTAKDAANYTASVSGLNEAAGLVYQNYTLVSAKKEFTIQPKTISFVNDRTYTYTGLEQSLSFKVTGIVSSDLAGLSADQFNGTSGKSAIVGGSVSGSDYVLTVKGTNAGTYNIGVDSFENTNYTMDKYSSAIAIAKKPLTVTWSIRNNATGTTSNLAAGGAYTYNYNGYEIIANVGGTVNGETVNLTMNRNKQSDAATYTTTAALPSSYTNYVMETKEISWTIKPYTLNVTWLFNGATAAGAQPKFTYSAAPVKVTAKYTPLGDDVVNLTYGKTENDRTNVGTYEVTVTGVSNTNYVLGTGKTLTWSIQPKTVNVVWSASAPKSSVYNGLYQGPQFTVNGLLETDGRFIASTVNSADTRFEIKSTESTAVYSFAGANRAVNVGDYEIIITSIVRYDSETSSYVVDPNYVIAADSFDFAITKRPLTLSGVWNYAGNGKSGTYGSSTSLVYNSKDFTLTTGIQSGLVEHLGAPADVKLVYTGNVARNYSATGYTARVTDLSGTHAENYQLPTTNVSKTWSIGKKSINFTWASNSFVYNGSAQIQNAQFATGAASDTDGKVYSGDAVTMTYTNNTKTNAGSYTATVTALSNSNYSIGQGNSYQWSIAPKPISLTWNFNTFVYNGNVQTPAASYSGSNDVNVTGYTTVNSRNVGEYKITATKLDNSNYVISGNASCTYNITPLTIKLNWRYSGTNTNVGNFTYDKVKRTVEAYATNLCTGDTVEFTYNPGSREILNAGSYSFAVTALSNPNYKLDASSSNAEETVVISQCTVSISWGTNSFTYDGSAHSLIPTVTGVNSSDKVPHKLKSNETSLTNVGSIKVEIASLEDSNYKLPSSNLSKTLTINPQPVTITWSGNTTVTYDGQVHTLTPTVKGTNDGKTVVFQRDGSYSRTDAGSQTITVTALENSNYTLTGATGSKSQTLRIDPRPVNVSWSGNTSVTYDGNPHSVIATVTGVGGKAVGFEYGSTANTQLNAGSYTVKVSKLSDSNYTLTGASKTSCDLVISPQKVRITWPATLTYTYDGQTRTVVPTIVGIDDGKPVLVGSYQSGNSLTNAGTLNVSVRTLADGNYTLSGATGDTGKTLTINQQAVKITWSGSTTLEYDGSAHSLTATVVGKNDGKSVNITYETGTSYTNAGTYTVSFRLNNNNYTLTGATGKTSSTMTINRQTASITWSGTNNVVYDGSSHTMTPTAKGTKDGKTVSLSFSTDRSFISAGTHTVTVALNDSNYVLEAGAKTSMTITIKPQPVVITWNGTGSYEFDSRAHTLVATVKGKNDSRNVDFTYTATNSFTNAGDYRTEIKLNDPNYTLEGGSGNLGAGLTITKQPVTITWAGNGTVTYNGSAHYLTATVLGKTDGKSVTFTYNGANSFTNVGSNTVSVKALTNSNYTLTGASNLTSPVLKIEPQSVTISWTGGKTQIYDGAYHSLTATVKGALDGKTLNFTYAAGSRSHVNVGTYSISVKSLSDSNYTLAGATNLTSPNLVIVPQPVTVTWTGGGTLTYDGTSHELSATVVGAQDGKSVPFTYNSNTRGFTNAGTYTVSIKELQSTNYTLEEGSARTSPALIIKPQAVVISWNNYDDIVYDGQNHEIIATVKGAVDGKTVDFTYASNMRAFTDVGKYSVTVKSLSNSNYTMDNAVGQKTVTFSITTRYVEGIWSGDTEVVYDGAAHSLTATIADLELGRDFVVTEASYVEPGEYEYTLQLINANCKFTDGTRKMTVTLRITEPETEPESGSEPADPS